MTRVLFLFFFLGASFSISCPKYDRLAQYGNFISWGDYQDTRAKVLIRDSKRPVTYRLPKTCVVDSGLWIDPYSGDTLFSASDLQIDHVVSLSEAHKSGAWAWTKEKRKSFTNFLDSSFHLLAVESALNSSKGDKDPGQWLPPNTSFVKEYVRDWIKIKVHWGLKADSAELAALKAILTGTDSSLVYPDLAQEDICTDTGVVVALRRQSPVPRSVLPLGLEGFLFNGKYLVTGKVF